MTEVELDTLILELQSTTPLSRVNHSEAHVIFARAAELGYKLTAPAAPIGERADAA